MLLPCLLQALLCLHFLLPQCCHHHHQQLLVWLLLTLLPNPSHFAAHKGGG
jgi:hypothetical protein